MDYVRGRVFKNIRLPDIADASTRTAIYDQMNQFVQLNSLFLLVYNLFRSLCI